MNANKVIANDAPGNIVNDERVIGAYLGAKYSQQFKARKEGKDLV